MCHARITISSWIRAVVQTRDERSDVDRLLRHRFNDGKGEVIEQGHKLRHVPSRIQHNGGCTALRNLKVIKDTNAFLFVHGEVPNSRPRVTTQGSRQC